MKVRGEYTVVQWLKNLLIKLENVERHLMNGGKLSLYLSTRSTVEMSAVTTEE